MYNVIYREKKKAVRSLHPSYHVTQLLWNMNFKCPFIIIFLYGGDV